MQGSAYPFSTTTCRDKGGAIRALTRREKAASDRFMHDPVYVLPRIPLLRGWVNTDSLAPCRAISHSINVVHRLPS